MRKTLLLLPAALCPFAGHAITLTLENPQVDVFPTLPNDLRGTVTLDAGETLYRDAITRAYNLYGEYFDFRFEDAAVNALVAGESYTGVLARAYSGGGRVGLYNQDGTGFGRPYVAFSAMNALGDVSTATQNYSVRFFPVPEPLTLATLGIGAAALVRRKRRA